MLTAYQLQAANELKSDTPSSSLVSSSTKPVLPPLHLAAASAVAVHNASTKSSIESQQTNKEAFDVACHEIRNFLFGISGMSNLLIKNNGALTELLETERGKTIEPAFREKILNGIAGIKNRIGVMSALACDQREIVNGLLGSPRDGAEKTVAESAVDSQKTGEKAIQILKAKFGIHGIIHELKKAHSHLEALLLSSEGQKLEISFRKEIWDLIGVDQRSIYILDLCVEGQEELVDGLGFSNSPPNKKTASLIQPKKIIAEVADILKEKLAEKKLKLELNMSKVDNIIVNGNPANLRRILINLVSNAIKFTNNQTRQGIIKINLADPIINSDATVLTFFVEDNGIGIKKSEQSCIFKSYQQANSQIAKTHGGTGLGLSSIKKLVESMDGKIECVSTENVGSKFIFKIKCPNSKPSDSSSSPLLFSTSITANKEKHVLIVDDHAINRRILQVFLQKTGYTFDIARNGKEAVELCENNKFDVILMDISMPVMNGLEATEVIRQSQLIKAAGNHQIPIIGLSADEESASLLKAKEAGMDDYLIKGSAFNQLLLLEKIKMLCSKDAHVSPVEEMKSSSTKIK